VRRLVRDQQPCRLNPVLHSLEQSGVASDSILAEKTILDAGGACLNFNLLTTKAGPIVIPVTWQQGILEIGDMAQEAEFVRQVCSRIKMDMNELARALL
jgi:hypothetical protein